MEEKSETPTCGRIFPQFHHDLEVPVFFKDNPRFRMERIYGEKPKTNIPSFDPLLSKQIDDQKSGRKKGKFRSYSHENKFLTNLFQKIAFKTSEGDST
ncbi:hypothetical protein CH375_05880 [Leptospira ellisii]|uniref:Uncharacterized protein n=1 Tax=Leptospira ellisii TaxID=2023197 RepID=A0A2N0BEI6_9LEPT|nr:hypothetical protein CH379_00335 [Leptospira ellisii]PKA05319.1 hypothetical protein CH375_05880 [Leptospira ellisii]